MDIISKKELTRRTIQRKALELTLSQGFDGFTMQDLADETEVSRTTVFNYFDDKASAVLGTESEADSLTSLEKLVQFPVAQPPPFDDVISVILSV